jgi:phosphoenolpyruvate synthase/pyruvate phosphate dikinase
MPLSDGPISRAYRRAGGMDRPSAPDMKPDELTGFPGSPGIAQGTVKVVREVFDAGKLNPGDILVTEYTLTSWAPLSGMGR